MKTSKEKRIEIINKLEKVGRDKFDRLIDKSKYKITYTPDTYYYDALMISKKTVYIIEIKDRKFESTLYGDTILEEKKFMDLRILKEKIRRDYKEKRDIIILYYTFYSDNIYKVFNLNNITIDDMKRFKEQIMNSNTALYDDKIIKKVISLKDAEATYIGNYK